MDTESIKIITEGVVTVVLIVAAAILAAYIIYLATKLDSTK